MKNKLLKFGISLLTMIVMCFVMYITVFAGEFDSLDQVSANQDSQVAGTFQSIGGKILAVVQIVGVAVAIIMLIFVAIKYLSAAPNDKAEIKKHAVVYIVGAVVLFGASGILQIIRDFADKVH